MDNMIKVVKVFIGSPGGLEDERQAAKRIIDEINQNHSEHWGCQIKLIGWEATLPSYSRAQSLINQDLDKCTYFVGIIWKHWGSKPDNNDNEYTSGFQEEYERAKIRVENGLMKDIALFFKDIPEAQLNYPDPSVKKVTEFHDDCIRLRKPLFKEFKETCDFEPLFRAKIGDIGWKESSVSRIAQNEISEPVQPSRTDKRTSNTSDSDTNLIEPSSTKFVNKLLQRPEDWEDTSSYEIARFRLIAASLNRPGNDEQYLGNHDANLLFENRKEFDFSQKEIRKLIKNGVYGFDHQNVPLWHWLANDPDSGYEFKSIQLLAIFGEKNEKINSIRILQCMGKKVPVLEKIMNRKKIIERWLLNSENNQETRVFLDFLVTSHP